MPRITLDGTNPMHVALGRVFGADIAVPAERTSDGQPGRRAAWPCPACDPTGNGPKWLSVDRYSDGGPPECYKGCSEAAIWEAIGQPQPERHTVQLALNRTPVAEAVSSVDTGRTSWRRAGDVLSGSSVLSESDVLSESGGDKRVSASDVSGWGKLREPVEAFARFLGASVALGRNFPCPLPGHTRRASFYEDPQTGVWKLCCWCSDEPLFLTVAEVRASIGYGSVNRLTSQRKSGSKPDTPPEGNAQAAVWYLRAWHDARLIAPLDFYLPAAPSVHPIVVAVHAGFRLLVGLRWLCYPGQPVAFARLFVPAWCDGSIKPMDGYRAVRELAEHGVIRCVGETTAGRWPLKLWLPGGAT